MEKSGHKSRPRRNQWPMSFDGAKSTADRRVLIFSQNTGQHVFKNKYWHVSLCGIFHLVTVYSSSCSTLMCYVTRGHYFLTIFFFKIKDFLFSRNEMKRRPAAGKANWPNSEMAGDGKISDRRPGPWAGSADASPSRQRPLGVQALRIAYKKRRPTLCTFFFELKKKTNWVKCFSNDFSDFVWFGIMGVCRLND